MWTFGFLDISRSRVRRNTLTHMCIKNHSDLKLRPLKIVYPPPTPHPLKVLNVWSTLGELLHCGHFIPFCLMPAHPFHVPSWVSLEYVRSTAVSHKWLPKGYSGSTVHTQKRGNNNCDIPSHMWTYFAKRSQMHVKTYTGQYQPRNDPLQFSNSTKIT